MSSQHSRRTPLPIPDVTIEDAFWAPHRETVRTKSLPHQEHQLRIGGQFEALRLEWKPGDAGEPHIFWESDVAKWIEAASYVLAREVDPDLDAAVDEAIALLSGAQQKDGYLNVYFTVVKPGQRFTDLRDAHELYCAGHLIEAGVAHHEATGKTTLLDIVRRYADLIDREFGPGGSCEGGYDGHEEIELALVKLYRATGERRYLDLALRLVDNRGTQPVLFRCRTRTPRHRGLLRHLPQDPRPPRRLVPPVQPDPPARPRADRDRRARRPRHVPLHRHGRPRRRDRRRDPHRSMRTAMGRHGRHQAVRHRRPRRTPRDRRLRPRLPPPRPRRLRRDVRCDRPGHVGPAHDAADRRGEVRRCPRTGPVQRRPLRHLRRRHPLLLRQPARQRRLRRTLRMVRLRLLPAQPRPPPGLPRALHLRHRHDRTDGQPLHRRQRPPRTRRSDRRLTQATDYPWDGRVRLTLEADHDTDLTLKLRLPDWSEGATLTIDGTEVDTTTEDGYLHLARTWAPGTVVDLDLGMAPKRVRANQKVAAVLGKVALQNGPIVYCAEGIDNAGAVPTLTIRPDAELRIEHDSSSNLDTITVEGVCERQSGDALYSTDAPKAEPTSIRAVPYFSWANRGKSTMAVWLRETAAGH